MKIGRRPSPPWAENLLYKWVEHDDPYFGLRITCFIYHVDHFPEDEYPFTVRIFFDEESLVRDEEAGILYRQGIAASYICEDKYLVIDTPKGLEEWTKNRISSWQKQK